ncbi:MAG: protein rep [Oscillospiraceae bacterium]|nr:protein rep [Oscillospiraceae bacterium]
MSRNNYTIGLAECQAPAAKIVDLTNNRYVIDEETGECLEILTDRNKRGRERPWRTGRINAQRVSAACKLLAAKPTVEGSAHWNKRAERLENCGTHLEFGIWHGQGEGGSDLKKLIKANFCTQRICPLCGWRRSLKIQASVRKILQAAEESGSKYEYLMLTLTIPNVTGSDLPAAITKMMAAWKRLSETKRFEDAVCGWYRGLEITHNVDRGSRSFDTYHPHFHTLLMVKPSYFKGKGYIKQEEWLQIWQNAVRDQSITQVDIRKVKPKNGKTDIVGAVCEVAKYTVKPSGYIVDDDAELTCSAVEVLDSALHGRRLVAFGGEMKRLRDTLQLDDETDGDLTVVGARNVSGDPDEVMSYFWHVGYAQYIKNS